MLTHLDLFSGIGGFALAAEWAGFKTIGFVEIDKYCQKVLRKHWLDVSIVEDIRDVEKIKEVVANATGWRLEEQRLRYKNQQSTQQDKGYRQIHPNDIIWAAIQASQPITLITGGFPCQPFSVAGKRKGTADNRYLWNEMLTVIKAVKPTWVLAENVSGIAGMEFTDSIPDLEGETPQEMEGVLSAVLDKVCLDLEKVGYEVQPVIIPACAVNAPHRRDRVWIVAYSRFEQHRGRNSVQYPIRENDRPTAADKRSSESREGEARKWAKYDITNGSSRPTTDVADPKSRQPRKQAEPEGGQDTGGRGGQIATTEPQREGQQDHQGCGAHEILGRQALPDRNSGQIRTSEYWCVEPELGRVAHGIPNRVDRLKCLGNAIVPQVAYQILKMIADIESRHSNENR